MSEESKDFIAQIVVEYNPETGKFQLHSNVHDEVLTSGMMAMAQERMKENYQIARIKAIQEREQKGIIAV